MAVPLYVGGGSGFAITTGTTTVTKTGCVKGNLLIFHVVVRGTGADWVEGNYVNVSKQDGTTSSATLIAFNAGVGSSKHSFLIGRVTADGTCSFDLTVGASGDDIFARIYEFSGVFNSGVNVGTGTIENGIGNTYLNSGGSAVTTIPDQACTTLGYNRLCLSLIGITTNQTVPDFTGETGGNWSVETEFKSSTGAVASLQLQRGVVLAPGTLDGGSSTVSSTDYGIFSFALVPAVTPRFISRAKDDFNRADNVSLGTNWETVSGHGFALNGFQIVSNAATFESNSDQAEVYAGSRFAPDQYSQARVTVVGGTTGEGMGVCVRASSPGTMYRCTVDGGGAIEVASFVAGSYTQLATRSTTWFAGDLLRLEAQGTTLRVFQNGAQLGADITNSAVTTGLPGLAWSSGATSGSADDWEGGAIPRSYADVVLSDSPAAYYRMNEAAAMQSAVLDAFTGSNETPIATNWSGPWYPGVGEMRRVSNQMLAPASVQGGSWYDLATFGPDCEVYLTIAAFGADGNDLQLYARMQSPGTTSLSGYILIFEPRAGGADFFRMYREDSGSDTLLDSDDTITWSTGDQIGLRCIGSNIQGWRKPLGGEWRQILDATDATYSAAGYFGVGASAGTFTFDDFGGGTVTATSNIPHDLSGNSNHMTYVNGTPDYAQAGPIVSDGVDAGINFNDASNEFFSAPDATTLDYGDTFTMECWLKRTNFDTREQGVITKGGEATGHAGGMYLINNYLSGAQTGIGYFVQANVTIPNDGNYYHCVVTKNGSTRLVYLNGVDVTNTGAFTNLTCTNTTQPLAIGTEYSVGTPQPVYLTSVVSEAAVYSTALTPSQIRAHYYAGISQYAATVLADGPAAYYRMQEASGLIQDSSGNAMNADASTGACSYHQTSPLTTDSSDYGIQFTAVQRFEVPDNATIDVGDVYTVEAWVKRATSGLATTETILDRGSGAFNFGIRGTDVPSATNRLFLGVPGTGDVVYSSIAITDTLWHHCVVSKNGSTIALYIDGVNRTGTVTNQTSASGASKLYIGATRNADDFMQSSLDEIAIYPYALTSSQVLSHYYAGISDYAAEVLADGPLAYYRMNETEPLQTAILDDFNRANNPVGANWTTGIQNGYGALTVLSNQCTGGTGFNAGYWNSIFGSDQEAYVTIAALPADHARVFARLTGSGATVQAYALDFYVSGAWQVDYWLAGAPAGTLSIPGTHTLVAGDSVALRVVGTTVSVYYKPSGGSWTFDGSAEDSHVAGSGYIGLEINGSESNTCKLDNFGGGTADSASKLPRDSSGNDNHMIFMNGSPTYAQTGAIATDPTDTAIRFDRASTESFAATDRLEPAYRDVFTLEAWVKRNSTSGSRQEGIVTKGDNVGGLYFQNDTLMLAKTSVGIIVQSTTTITDTTSFHHLVVTKDGATSKLYIDGVDVTGTVSDATCTTDGGHGQEIGAEFGTAENLDGIADEVLVYGTALSAARVLAHYQAAQSALARYSTRFMDAIGW